MSKQSSIEWLISHIAEDQTVKAKSQSEWLEIIEQAKAMHKEEMITTWHKGYDNLSPMIDENNCGDKYYNETYEPSLSKILWTSQS